MTYLHKLAKRLSVNDVPVRGSGRSARSRPVDQQHSPNPETRSSTISIRRTVLTPVLVVIAAACAGTAATGPDNTEAIVAIAIQPADQRILLGDSLDLWVAGITATGDAEPIETAEVMWSVSGGDVVETGNGKGKYRPTRPGKFKVTATVDTLSDSTAVTVVDTIVANVAVTPATASVAVGANVQFTATPRDSVGNNLEGHAVTWTSSAPGVASVSAAGLVTGIAAGTATITATADGTAGTGVVTVTSPSAPPPVTGLDFASDWATAVGTTATALFDGGKPIPWDGKVDGNNSNLSVVAANATTLTNRSGETLAQQGWPTANALRVLWDQSGGIVYSTQKWRFPAVGESLFLRWYYVHDGNDALGGYERDNSNHSPQSIGVGGLAGACAGPWSQRVGNRGRGGAADGTYLLRIGHTTGTSTVYFELDQYLQKGAVYRFELRVHRTADTVMQLHARAYNAAGTLIGDDDNFLGHDGRGGLADNRNLPLLRTWIDQSCLSNAAWGSSGSTGTPSGVVVYQGAVAARVTTDGNAWIGPHQGS